jgi:oligopeptide/dipeptide ABC transporter ATP-binding protein
VSDPLLHIDRLSIAFDTEGGRISPVTEVSLSLFPGQTLAVVGESGCGKSITAMSVLRLLPSPPTRYPTGRIIYDGRDLLTTGEKQMQRIRGGQIAMIFQEPMTSLNPVYTIGEQIVEAILLHQPVKPRQARQLAADALREVGIADPESRLDEYPHRLSGGMRQRVMIAMALACKPRILIADEPTTALDVTIQAQILELLRKLQRDTGMSILLITHDLGVVAENADAVAVMYAGRVVEYAAADELFDHPQHPYTRGLFASIPRLGSRVTRLKTIAGTVPAPAQFPVGCRFHPRCPAMQGDRTCAEVDPQLREVRPGHWAACHHVPGFASSPATDPAVQGTRSRPLQDIDAR